MSRLTEMTWGSNKLHFTYDSTGPASVTYNGNRYFYLKNAQGDVTGLVNASGTQVVSYTYDPWGAPLSTDGTMASTPVSYTHLSGSVWYCKPLKTAGLPMEDHLCP